MAFSDPIGEFEFTSRGLTVSDPSSSGGGSLQVNYEGTATGYGFVASTMTFAVQEPGAKEGTVSANNVAWLENGESMSGVSSGVFNESGTLHPGRSTQHFLWEGGSCVFQVALFLYEADPGGVHFLTPQPGSKFSFFLDACCGEKVHGLENSILPPTIV